MERRHYSSEVYRTAHEMEVAAELEEATQKFPPIRSPHEGVAIIEEEFEEFKREVFWGTPEKAREEVVQLIAMGLRYMRDCNP